MNKIYDRIIDIRGNLITIIAKGVKIGELAKNLQEIKFYDPCFCFKY